MLDFSKITTKDLEVAVSHQPKYICWGIKCYKCPWTNNCREKNIEQREQSFRDEVKRRKTEMIDLEVGMVIEYDHDKYFMVMPDTGDKVGFMFINDKGEEAYDIDYNLITSVFCFQGNYTYAPFFDERYSVLDYVNLLWERESPQEKKLKELEDTIKKAQEQIEEIRKNG